MPPKGKQASGLLTQQKMLRAAITQFLKHGYGDASTAGIATEAGMTPSSFFRAYPSKEALLLELVQWIFIGQYDLAKKVANSDDPMLICAVEGALEIHTAELSEALRDLYVTAYSLPSTSLYIYRVMSRRLYEVFSEFQPDARERDFYELEIASASMIRGYIAVPTDAYLTVEAKITRFLECALKLYNIEEPERKRLIETTLAMDLHNTAIDIVESTVRKVKAGLPIQGALTYD